MSEKGNARMGGLLEQARAGDRDSLNEIVRELTPLLWHVARAQGLDRESSSDVVQHAWLTFVRSMDTIREPAAVVGWLVQVTKREAWQLARRARPEELTGSPEVYNQRDRSPGPEELALTQEAHRELWTAVQQLSERCRQLLRIVAFMPRPDYREISSSLGMPKGSIGPIRGRCLARLRAALESGVRDDG